MAPPLYVAECLDKYGMDAHCKHMTEEGPGNIEMFGFGDREGVIVSDATDMETSFSFGNVPIHKTSVKDLMWSSAAKKGLSQKSDNSKVCFAKIKADIGSPSASNEVRSVLGILPLRFIGI